MEKKDEHSLDHSYFMQGLFYPFFQEGAVYNWN